MSIKIYLKFLTFATFVALIYIHMQMKIYELAYTGKDKEKHFYELSDANGGLTHQILTLKSANHLGNKLLDKDASLQFMGKDHMMTLRTPADVISQPIQPKPKGDHPIWPLLSWLSPSEAKAGE